MIAYLLVAVGACALGWFAGRRPPMRVKVPVELGTLNNVIRRKLADLGDGMCVEQSEIVYEALVRVTSDPDDLIAVMEMAEELQQQYEGVRFLLHTRIG